MQWKNIILDWFFPRLCPICGQHLEEEEWICPDCFLSLPRTEECAQIGNKTEELFVDEPSFKRGASYFLFEQKSDIQTLIHHMKYRNQPLIGYELGKEAARDFLSSDFFDGIDCLIPIPLHPKRFRERGFNQSEWIARGLSEITHIPMDLTHLTRTRNNPQQANTIGKQRLANVKGIFAVNHPEELYHKHILLVDDIVTTGSTLRACMDALPIARGCTISIFALGKAT